MSIDAYGAQLTSRSFRRLPRFPFADSEQLCHVGWLQ
eukprot:COSAG03_NODE_15676_length_423_cov_1.259259_1_plen_36_part_10